MKVFLISITALILLPAGITQEDETATIAGHVVDPHHRVVAHASITLEGPRTAAAVTDENGDFSLPKLPPGAYRLTIQAFGFAGAERALELQGAAVRLYIQLSIASAEESVTVSAQENDKQETLQVSEIRQSSAKDVGEALATIDGLWKIRKGGIANDVVLRGLQRDNVNVLIDGSRVYGACPSRMDPAAYHVDFAEVEHIEVVKGPFDVANQGSLAGVVNVVSRTSAPGISIRPSLAAGSYAYLNPSLVSSYATDSFSVLGGYSFRTSDPYSTGAGKPFTSYTNYRSSVPRAFDIHTAWMKTEFVPRAGHRFSLDYTRQRSGPVLYPYLMMDANSDNADRVSFEYKVRDISNQLKALRVQSYFTRVTHFMSDEFRTSSATAVGPFSMASDADASIVGGRMEAQLDNSLLLGIETYRRKWDVLNSMVMMGDMKNQRIIPNVGTASAGAFADFHHNLTETVRMSGGTRLDYAHMQAATSSANANSYFAYKGTRRSSNSDAAPSGNIRIAGRVRKSADWFAGVGSALRFPDAQERYFSQTKIGQDVVGNPLLNPVRNTQFTAGLNYRHGSSYIKPVLFYGMLSDYIVVNDQQRLNIVPGIMSASARSFANVDARIYGGEVSYALALSGPLLLSGGVSYVRGSKDRNLSAGITDTDLAEMPPLRSWSALRYSRKVFFAEIGAVAAGRQDRVDSDLKETPTAGYGVLNFKCGVQVGTLYLTGFVDNLLNKEYAEHFSYSRDPFRSGVKIPEPGRSLSAIISYRF